MLAVQTGHTVDENVDILVLTGIYQSLYILRFILFQHLGRQYVKLHLQQIHQQATGAPITISPRMDGHQLEVRPKAQFVDGSNIVSIDSLSPTIQFFAESSQTCRHFQV